MFQIFAGRQMHQGIQSLREGTTPRCHGHMGQLSRKGRLDGSAQRSQAVAKTQPHIRIFPEEMSSRERFLLPVFSHWSALTVGCRFGAAATPPGPFEVCHNVMGGILWQNTRDADAWAVVFVQRLAWFLAFHDSLFKPIRAVMPRILCTIVHAATQDPCATVCRPAGCVLGLTATRGGALLETLWG
jgi:hypothetical protein